jgi:polyhydroxyalkanoate synthase
MMIDLMAWNADTTRMPARMHSEYLRDLFLNNSLSRGQYLVEGRPIALTDIRIPIFAVATEKDHVSPWRSVYKLHLLTDTALTFVLTTGGHNAGIVSEPGHRGRSFRMETREGGRRQRAAEDWLREAPRQEGSWWPAWHEWLARRSGALTRPPRLAGGDPAPGRYVRES